MKAETKKYLWIGAVVAGSFIAVNLFWNVAKTSTSTVMSAKRNAWADAYTEPFCPGSRIRSNGLGRGLGYGIESGPIGRVNDLIQVD